jgi:phenylpropionate dioxygenase-like ring-hydroxylating dioxygenase large terminal subunit
MPMPGNSDPREGVLGREIFVDESIYRTELGRIFARAWLFVGHESQLPNLGDFFLSRTGEDSVIVSRDLNGKVNVLLNSCRHRGMRVCRYEQGNTSNFTCPYHGWSYRSDGSLGHVPGELIGVPWQKVAYSDRLDKSQWGLIRASKIEVYKGSVWATWDDSTPGFLDYLGGMKVYFDELLDARDGGEGGSEVISGVLKWRMACNWKFCAENFAWDTYHAHTTHRSAEVAGIGPGGKGSERHGARQRSNARDFRAGSSVFRNSDMPC